MAGPLPSVPNNFLVQVGNGQVYLNWSPVVSSTAYYVLRSTDSINFSQIATVTGAQYYDVPPSSGVYYYQVKAASSAGVSNPTAYQSVTPVQYGQVSLGQVRLAAQQRADMVNNNFVTIQEWNSYISKSYAELYDILVQVYGDEYEVGPPYQFTTDGRVPALYPLPTNFYKILGVDAGISNAQNAYLTLKKFPFASRNKYIYGNTPVSFLGFLQLKYRIVGNNIMLLPQPSTNQLVQLWIIPRPSVLMADSDILDGISGWDEYVIVDAAIKAMQKEESDVSVLMAQKADLRRRIEAAASNRDAGMPEAVTDVRGLGYGESYDSPFGGF
jgi:hypothetical protein